jgi:hypothetical protein
MSSENQPKNESKNKRQTLRTIIGGQVVANIRQIRHAPTLSDLATPAPAPPLLSEFQGVGHQPSLCLLLRQSTRMTKIYKLVLEYENWRDCNQEPMRLGNIFMAAGPHSRLAHASGAPDITRGKIS